MISAEELADRLTLVALFWPEYKEALQQDQERRFLRRVFGVVVTDVQGRPRIRAHVVDADAFSAYVDSMHPPGVTVFRSRTSGRKRRRPAPRYQPGRQTDDWLLDRAARGLPIAGVRL